MVSDIAFSCILVALISLWSGMVSMSVIERWTAGLPASCHKSEKWALIFRAPQTIKEHLVYSLI